MQWFVPIREVHLGGFTIGMTNSGDQYGSEKTTLTGERRELIEEIAEWDEEEYPIAEHARRILENLE